jgi:hypothetical protein
MSYLAVFTQNICKNTFCCSSGCGKRTDAALCASGPSSGSGSVTALQASWFKKILGKPYDNWRRDVHNLCGGNILIANKSLVSNKNSPILEGLFDGFHRFRKCFIEKEGNVLKSDLLYNPAFDNRGGNEVTETIFRHNIPDISLPEVAKLKVSDFFDERGIKSLDSVCADTGLPVNLVTYLRLTGPLHRISNTVMKIKRDNTIGLSLQAFFLGFIKGSKQIRKTLEGNRKNKKVDSLQTVKTFFRLTEIPVPLPAGFFFNINLLYSMNPTEQYES